MHIDAVQHDVRIFEARAERRPGRYAEQFLAVKRVHQQQRLRKVGDRLDLFAQPEPVEHMENVGAKLNAVADGAELRRAFEDANGAAALRQGQRRGQPA